MALRHSFIIFALFSVISLLSLVSVEAATHMVYHDGGIVYNPSTCDLDCTRVCRNEWWISCALTDGRLSHRTKGNNTSANFSFKGSSVTWYTRTSNDGGKAKVYIDDVFDRDIDTNTPTTNDVNPIYTKSGLDPSVTHTISVVYNLAAFTEAYERFVDIHGFEYDDGVGSGGTSPTTAQTPSSSNTGASSTTSSSTTSRSSSSVSTNSNGTQSATSMSSYSTIAPVLVTFNNGTVETILAGDISGAPGAGSTSVSTTALVGAVLGTIIAMLIFAFCFFFIRRRRREAARMAYISKEGSGQSPPGPYPDSPNREHSGNPHNSTDALFHNPRDHTRRNPRDENLPPVGYPQKGRFGPSNSRNTLGLHHNDEGTSPGRSHQGPHVAQPYQTSDVSYDDQSVDDELDNEPMSAGSATRMTDMSRESAGPHVYGMTQAPLDRRSSGGTWLPNTPPPIYRK